MLKELIKDLPFVKGSKFEETKSIKQKHQTPQLNKSFHLQVHSQSNRVAFASNGTLHNYINTRSSP